MKKTGGEILNDVYALVGASPLATAVNGGVYKNERPAGSQLEDIVISFTDGSDGQFQEGVVSLRVYVPDIDDGSGNTVQNSARTDAIEAAINSVLPSFTSAEYYFTLDKMIRTNREEGTAARYVVADLRFKKSTLIY